MLTLLNTLDHSPRTRKQSTVHRGLVQHNVASENQGPVVQSVVSLTSSLRVISLTVLTDSIYNILIFFAEKCLLTFFQQKISAYLRITRFKF